MVFLFSEVISVSTGSVIIRNEDGTIFESVSGAGLSIGGSGPYTNRELWVEHADFAADAVYFIELQANVVTDESGNANEAWGDAFTMAILYW